MVEFTLFLKNVLFTTCKSLSPTLFILVPQQLLETECIISKLEKKINQFKVI